MKPPQVPPQNTMNQNIETSKRDFKNILGKIPLNTEYSISDLEFEFELSWKDLEPLLYASCIYALTDDKVIITSKESSKQKEDEWKKIRAAQEEESVRKDEVRKRLKPISKEIFFKKGKYRSILADEWPSDQKELLELCLELGIIQKWWHGKILVLEGHNPSWNNKM